MINETTGRPSTPGLLADAMAQMTRLLETEIRLIRTELGEKVAEAVRAIAIIAVSAVLFLVSLILVLEGLVFLLVYFGMPPFAASFTVAAVIAVVGGLAIWLSLRHLSASGLMPRRTLDQLSKDAHVVKEQMS